MDRDQVVRLLEAAHPDRDAGPLVVLELGGDLEVLVSADEGPRAFAAAARAGPDATRILEPGERNGRGPSDLDADFGAMHGHDAAARQAPASQAIEREAPPGFGRGRPPRPASLRQEGRCSHELPSIHLASSPATSPPVHGSPSFAMPQDSPAPRPVIGALSHPGLQLLSDVTAALSAGVFSESAMEETVRLLRAGLGASMCRLWVRLEDARNYETFSEPADAPGEQYAARMGDAIRGGT